MDTLETIAGFTNGWWTQALVILLVGMFAWGITLQKEADLPVKLLANTAMVALAGYAVFVFGPAVSGGALRLPWQVGAVLAGVVLACIVSAHLLWRLAPWAVVAYSLACSSLGAYAVLQSDSLVTSTLQWAAWVVGAIAPPLLLSVMVWSVIYYRSHTR